MTWLQQMGDAGWTVELWNTYDRKWCLRLRYGADILSTEHESLLEALAQGAVEWRMWNQRRTA